MLDVTFNILIDSGLGSPALSSSLELLLLGRARFQVLLPAPAWNLLQLLFFFFRTDNFYLCILPYRCNSRACNQLLARRPAMSSSKQNRVFGKTTPKNNGLTKSVDYP